MSTSETGVAASVRLERRGDRLRLLRDGHEPATVVLRLVRPLSDPGGAIGVCDTDGKELALLPGLQVLDDDSRRAAEIELALRYPHPSVRRIRRLRREGGDRLLVVDTDAGERSFLLGDPERSMLALGDGGVLLVDRNGARYRIVRDELDPQSRRLFDTLQ